MRIILVLYCLICVSLDANGQIKGLITDIQNKPLPGVLVMLTHLPDSSIDATEITDEYGTFSFLKVNQGNYFVKTAMIGFSTAHSSVLKFDGKEMTVPSLKMTENINELREVTVNATQPAIEQKSDRLVVNVEKMNTAGDNALEVLKKAPGIRLDKDDNILLRGNAGVTVMINGKLTYMSGAELSNYLKMLPAGSISKIELIANPPANYDAEGTAGIVNIILKRNHSQGYNGTITSGAGYGRYGKLANGCNVNYNTGKLSFYTRVGYNYSESYNKLTLGRQIKDELYNQTNYWHPVSNAVSYTAGADYYISKKSTIGMMLKGYNSIQDATQSTISKSTDIAGNQTGMVEGINDQKTANEVYNVNLNYAVAIDSTGRKLSFDADYVSNYTGNKQNYINSYFAGNNDKGNSIYLRNSNPVQYTIRAIKGDYVHPIAKSWFAESGFKSSWVATNNNAQFDSLRSTGWVKDSLRSSHFRYNEQINAAYVTFNTTIRNKWDIKASLRAEHTSSTTDLVSFKDTIKRNFLSYFPGVFITYNVTQGHRLNVSFSNRITRQNYSTLNPFIKYADPYTAHMGNPYLKSSLSESFLASYTYKNFQILSLSYLKVKDAISRIVYQNDVTKESINKYENLGATGSFIASSAGSFNMKKWWSVTFNVAASYDFVNTVVQGSVYTNGMLSALGSVEQNFILPKNVKILLSSEYGSPSVSGLERTLSASQVDVGISKSLFHKKVTISFKARDIFFSNRYRSVLRYNNVNTTWNNEYESRRFSLNATYNFGNSKLKASSERTTSTGTEESRI